MQAVGVIKLLYLERNNFEIMAAPVERVSDKCTDLATDWPFTDPKRIEPLAKILAFRSHKDQRWDDFVSVRGIDKSASHLRAVASRLIASGSQARRLVMKTRRLSGEFHNLYRGYFKPWTNYS